jgi:putative transcriptional regulator
MSSRRAKRSVGARIVGALKEFAEAVEAGDDLNKRFTCRTVRLNLTPQPYSPELVRKTRQLLGASQAIFAQFLGVSANAVQDWEQGIKPPKGSACRLMDEIRENPGYWIRRLRELATPVGADRT